MENGNGAAPLPFSIPPELRGQIFVGDFIYPRYRLFILGVAVAAVAATWFIVYRTAFGRVVRAGVQNPDVVGALGISLAPYMTVIAALGVGLAGLAGVLLAPIAGVHPAMGAEILTAAFVVVVIGGVGSIRGAFYGALLAGLIDTLLRAFLPGLLRQVMAGSNADALGAGLSSMGVYLLMAIVLLVTPKGLFVKQS